MIVLPFWGGGGEKETSGGNVARFGCGGGLPAFLRADILQISHLTVEHATLFSPKWRNSRARRQSFLFSQNAATRSKLWMWVCLTE